jgi:insertion element IS1 protein InsB
VPFRLTLYLSFCTTIQHSIKTYHCSQCGSEDIVKNGADYKGDQKYYCHHCHAYGTLEPQGHSTEEQKEMALRAYQERVSMRGITRIFGIARQTLTQWLKKEASVLPNGVETVAKAQPDDVLELDELWSFVQKKSNRRWVWIALCRRTRQIVAFFVGDRREKSCWELWKRIPKAYKACCPYSDFWHAYQKVFSSERHQSVGKASGKTAHVERWNNTLRQRLARFVRKTLSFSKSDFFHTLVLKLFIHRYNLSVA